MMEGFSLNDLRQEVLGVLILLALSFLFFDSIYLRNVSAINETGAKISTLQREITQIEAEVSASSVLRIKLDEVKSGLNKTEADIARLEDRLPSSAHVSEVIKELTRYESSRGTTFVSVKPLAPVEAGDITRLPIHIRMESRFKEFGNYLERVENLRRVISVDNFRIENEGGARGRSPTLKIELYLSAYSL
jgi:Tfp pilus assembly protein PilO